VSIDLPNGIVSVQARGHQVVLQTEDTDGNVLEWRLSAADGYRLMRDLVRACYAADEARKRLTGAKEWRCQVLVPGRATVQHDDHATVFSRHVCRASKYNRKCSSCGYAFATGDVYWREADEVERKRWSGHRLCDGCVRPETMAAKLLDGSGQR